MATEPIKGFKPGMIHIGKDGDLVKSAKQAAAIVPGLIRKDVPAAKPKPDSDGEGKMASQINGMKRKGKISTDIIKMAPPGATQKGSITSKSSTSPQDALPDFRKPRRAKGLPANRGA